jgi:putative DNA methylase
MSPIADRLNSELGHLAPRSGPRAGRGVDVVQKRKLIEVALPLEAINRESAREKSIRQGHPSTLHLWWARRPLAAARAVLFAQLVDDPSSLPEEFPTEELQRAERERLHGIIERLVVWENIRDEKVLREAREEIVKSTGGTPPIILDPFAGGGAIPLEAERLGLEAEASDLNPVAVLINKALIELPPAFRDRPPIFPGLADSQIRSWSGVDGLAADVAAYGEWLREAAQERVGRLYPDVTLTDGSSAPVIAWLWARTVACPNPACGVLMPLVRTWWLSTKKGGEVRAVPKAVPDATRPSGSRIGFDLKLGRGPADEGTVSGRSGAICVACDSVAAVDYLRSEGKAGRMGQELLAVVASSGRKRVYAPATSDQVLAATIDKPDLSVSGEIATNPRWFSPPGYGLTQFDDLFTARQLTTLATLSDLVAEARVRVRADGGDAAYADAVATYLGLGVSRTTDLMNSMVTWSNSRDQARNTFSRQAIGMAWDFVEVNPFAGAAGDVGIALATMAKALLNLAPNGTGRAVQADASTRSYDNVLICTDPPYYDNIGYSDLSDFFYVWLRRTLRDIYPDLLSTMLVPKAEELVANPYRHGGKSGAEEFFEDSFRRVFSKARESASSEHPIAVYYAFKQSESDESGEASTGWETLLEGMIQSGWEITSTWPLRSERHGRMISVGTNALASSIVLSLRPRPNAGPTTDRRGFIAALESELPDALRKLQQGQIAPVDLPQAAIGPGMAVFSRYGAVLEPDGKKMTVRSALSRINEILDQVLNEQEGDFDSPSRFAIAWYRQHGYGVGTFGDANNLANARNTTVDVMDRDGILTSRAGKVQLIKPVDLSWDYDPVKDTHTSNWEALHHLIKVLERDGLAPAGDFLQAALSRPDGAVDADLVKELAHLLFRVAEGNGSTKDALSFNSLVASWPEILDVARSAKKPAQSQGAFEFDEDE